MSYDPKPEAETKVSQPSPSPSTLRFTSEDVFELVMAGTKLALFVLSDNDCLLCMAHGPNMMRPEAHHPYCQVARWLQAASLISVEQRGGLICRNCRQPICHFGDLDSAYLHIETNRVVCESGKTLAWPESETR